MNNDNPALEASIKCLEEVIEAIESNKCFRLEAGAGAGKTYTLIKSLERIIKKDGVKLMQSNQRIACITYTNVAKDEIRSRTDNHPVISADTIHAFCWDILKKFQKPLRKLLPALSERWKERSFEINIADQEVIYNLGYPKLTETEAFLHHNDVLKLMSILLTDEKFRKIVKNRFPVIFIDEYQDTNKELAQAIVDQYIESGDGPLIGFFGDHWQKIYGANSVGLISASPEKLKVIGKNANFRSDCMIVEALSRMRPELPQFPSDPESTGEILIFDSNAFTGVRRTGQHWKDDLPEVEAHDFFHKIKDRLSNDGWSFEGDHTKILMLTNTVLAAEQGYANLIKAFDDSEDLVKKNDHYISFLVDILEPALIAFEKGKFGDMFGYFNLSVPKIQRHSEKQFWHNNLTNLVQLRLTGTIGEMLDAFKKCHPLRLPGKILERESEYKKLNKLNEAELDENDKKTKEQMDKLLAVSYREIIAFSHFIEKSSPFSTKHGVKGAQFNNVIVVLGRGWNQYNWNQMLEWVDNVPAANIETFERSRNLFYVSCSRAKHKLALIFTQKLSDQAKQQLKIWFAVEPKSEPF